MNLDLTYFHTTFNNNAMTLDMYHNYYNGIHEMYYGIIKQYPKLNDLIIGTKSNVCKAVIDIICSRLEVETVRTDNDEANEFIGKYFRENRVKSLIKCITRDTILYGSGYVSLWIDKNGDIKLFEKTPYNTLPHYNSHGEIDCAVSYQTYKDIKNMPHTKVFVYYPDKIYKAEYDGEYFNPTMKPQEEYSNPFNKVPIFHFNNSYSKTDLINSDIKDVIPLQRSLNKFWQDLNICSHLCAFKQKYITGITMEHDEDGKPINPFESNMASVWVSEDADTKFGEFSATDLTNYTEVIDSIHKEISSVSRIPQHLFNLTSGAFASGEALRLAESPLNSKIEDKKVIIGDTLEDIFRLICEYKGYNVSVLETVWSNKEPYSESEKLINASNKIALGIDSDTVLSELGYSLVEDTTQF